MFFAPSKSRLTAKICVLSVLNTSNNIRIKIKMPNPGHKPPASSKAPNENQRTWMCFAPSKSRLTAKICIIGVSNTSNHIKIIIKVPNPSQELPWSFKAPYVLYTFKTKIESQNLGKILENKLSSSPKG